MRAILAAMLFGLVLGSVAFAEEQTADQQKQPYKPIRIDREKKIIEVDGRICLDQGPLELLACADGGKEYESLVALKGKPWQLHLYLLLIGLKPGGGPKFQGDETTPYGDGIIIEVEWQQDGKTIRKRAEDLMWDTKRDQPMQHIEWVFIGSKLIKDEEGNEFYAANRDKSIVTVYHDPFTVVDNPNKSGADDTTFIVNTKAIPPLDTPVTVIFRPGKTKMKKPEPDKTEDQPVKDDDKSE